MTNTSTKRDTTSPRVICNVTNHITCIGEPLAARNDSNPAGLV